MTTMLVSPAGHAPALAVTASSCGIANVAIGSLATTSSTSGGQKSANAVDGKANTRWASVASDPQWIQLDLGSRQNVCQVGLDWAAFASAYSIQVSDDATNWVTLVSTGTSSNTLQTVTVFGSGRYIRMHGTTRGVPTSGYSLKEFQVHTQPSQAPAFTSGASTTFRVGTPGSFSVTTSGVPAVTKISQSGGLPAGMTFADNGNGTAAIAGTPTGPGGDYPVTLTATNGIAPNATQNLVLRVNEAPAITSANTAAFTVRSAGSFTITTTGYPAAAITETGSLPSGLTFQDNGNGSATISGTPAAGAGGNYTLNLTADNGISPNAIRSLTINVGQPPAFTSPATATFVIGTAGSFNVTTSGFPTVSTITESGTLPAGITFIGNGNGTATIAGTPTGTGNTYPVQLTAGNGVSPNTTQNLTIQVNQAPAITLHPTDQTAQPGNWVSFTAAASGVPTPTMQWQQSTDGGASFTNIADATSTTYTFTAAAGDDNQYRAVFSNGVGSPGITIAATLKVGIAPAFTSADHTSFVVGQASSFTITTTGVPSATLSRTGAQFPAWLTLTDNGDGTGTLTGPPPTGSAGQYQFTLKAANGFSPSASQAFTLLVDDSPVITSADYATFAAGQAGSFLVTTTAGFPTTTALSQMGSLPSGVTFHDNGDGTATLAGTPAAGTGESYPITITATAVGGLALPATQSFTLTVLAPPTITSADHATFSEGAAGSFTVTTSAGNPATTTLSKIGTLPSWVTFTDNGDGTATIACTPNAGSGGVYTITITASNGFAPDATQTFTLTMNTQPQITSADHASFTVNTADAFTVTTVGQPTPSLSKAGNLPPDMTFTDNGDGTATLGGTPTTDGSYTFTITASNGVLPDATQTFTLTTSRPSVPANAIVYLKGTPGWYPQCGTGQGRSVVYLTPGASTPNQIFYSANNCNPVTLARLSPNRTKVAILSGGSLGLINVPDAAHAGYPNAIPIPSRSSCYLPAWSPDSAYVACSTPYGGHQSQIVITDATSGATASIIDLISLAPVMNAYSLAWLSSGDLYVIGLDADAPSCPDTATQPYASWLVQMNGVKAVGIQRLSAKKCGYQPQQVTVSPDNTKVAFVSQGDQLRVAPLDLSQEVTMAAGTFLVPKAWATDGSAVIADHYQPSLQEDGHLFSSVVAVYPHNGLIRTLVGGTASSDASSASTTDLAGWAQSGSP